MSSYQYYCDICNRASSQKSHSDSHISSQSHIQNCNIYKCSVLEKTNILSLINDYQVTLDKPLYEIYNDILLKKSQLKLLPHEITLRKNRANKIDKHAQVPICITHELTQFTKGKTEQTLNQITERYLLNTDGIDEHVIDVIITNNSLPETEQWKIRTKTTFGATMDINIDILSSSKDSDYSTIDKYIRKIVTAKNKSELPNILIVCFHKKRVCNDLFTLFETFCGGNYVLNFTKIKFHLNFDEPDTNLGVTSQFLSRYKSYSHIICGIVFITATPYDEFWEMLQRHGITTLLNLQHKNQVDSESYEEYLANYRSFYEHDFIYCNNDTTNPLEYIKEVFEGTYIDDTNITRSYIDKSKPYIIFAPAHLYTEVLNVGSHEEVVAYFTSQGDTVYLSNANFKGFVDPSGSRQLLTDFNQQHNITGELRDSLRKWRELNPLKNIIVTGYWTIERGITFCTDGFCFDYAIISTYHTNKMNKLVQLVGRTTGNKKYVNHMTIICPKIVYDTVNTLVENTIQLRKLNPENYNKTDFSIQDSSIPVKIEFVDDDYRQRVLNSITKKRNYKENLHSLLKDGVEQEKIKITDKNNRYKLDFDERKLRGVKVFTTGDVVSSRRFKEFSIAFDLFKGTSQTCNENEYCIDLAKDQYINGDFINSPNIAWITFKH